MATPRRKAPKIDAPSTIGEATDLVAEYLSLTASVEQTKAEADTAIRQIEHARDQLLGPVEAAIREKFAQLRTWWAVARDELTDGKRKSIELAGAQIGDRTTPPALKAKHGTTLGDVLEEMIVNDDEDYLVTKYALNKPLILQLLRGQVPDTMLQPGDNVEGIARLHIDTLSTDYGLRADQREEFFIDRAAPKEADPVVLPEAK